jgi:Na+/proline symporter
MVLIVAGLVAAVVVLVLGLPDDVGVVAALKLAGATGRMQTFDFSFDLTNQYTFWSGTIAALFLFCSYFGTDQSQVQRYLTTASVNEARESLLMSAYYKIPLQALVLVVGVLMFMFYVFAPTPMLFNTVHERELRQGPRAAEYAALERRFEGATASRSAAATVATRSDQRGNQTQYELAKTEFVARDAEVKAIRGEALSLVRAATGDQAFSDVNYVFPTFIVTHMPIALPGLLIAAIFAAAMSTISAELAALSTATVIDFYRRFWRPDGDDASTLRFSRIATGFWGLFASAVAIWAAELGSLIEVVNRFGSFFYGSILGVFMLAIGWKGATSNGAFIGLFAGMGSVALAATFTRVAFLWHNVIGAVAVVIVGVLVSVVERALRGKSVEGGL